MKDENAGGPAKDSSLGLTTGEACCTCAAFLDSVSRFAPDTEKPLPDDRRLECCGRVICGKCIHNNRRFERYCPYCQVSNAPSSIPSGLRRSQDPPVYTSLPSSTTATQDIGPPPPPPYSEKHPSTDPAAAPKEPPGEDVLHFLDHAHDTITSLSLRYGVPASELRRTNQLATDGLLLGRRTVLIPGEWYRGGTSLSPRPVEGEEEELRKSKIRRFMVGCKVADYDVALLYLEQAGYDLPEAMERWTDDERWERENPNGLHGAKKGKRKSILGGRR